MKTTAGYIIALILGLLVGWVAQQFWLSQPIIDAQQKSSNYSISRQQQRLINLQQQASVVMESKASSDAFPDSFYNVFSEALQQKDLDSALELFYRLDEPSIEEALLLAELAYEKGSYELLFSTLYEFRYGLDFKAEQRLLTEISSLVEQVDKPNLSGVVRNSYARISHLSGPNALYVRDFSKDVGYVLYSMTDYSSVTDLDPTEELLIADETTGYYVTQESSGFGLFDSTTLVEVTSNNPSVIAGNIYTYNGRVYEVLTNNTDRPDLGALLDPPTWLDLGVVNPLRMFDGKLDSLTASTSPLVVEITPNVIVNGIAIFNINATTVQITMNAPTDGLVYDSGVIDLVDSGTITGWYEFFFGQRLQKFDLVKTDLPTYPSATITINAIGGDDITVGEIVVGKIQNIGDAQYGTSVGIIDFSRKEADQFGIFSIVKRRFSKRAEYDIKIPTGQNSGVQRTLADFRTTPLVWVGDENKLETVVYGYYRNFDILIAGPSLSDCTITVEGL